jgi:hypothetical protein
MCVVCVMRSAAVCMYVCMYVCVCVYMYMFTTAEGRSGQTTGLTTPYRHKTHIRQTLEGAECKNGSLPLK